MNNWIEKIMENGAQVNHCITEASRLALKNPRMEFRARLYANGAVNILAFSDLDADHEPGADALDTYQMSYQKWDVLSILEDIQERFFEIDDDPRQEERQMLLKLMTKCLNTVYRTCRPESYADGDLLLQDLKYHPAVQKAFYELVDYVHDHGMVKYIF